MSTAQSAEEASYLAWLCSNYPSFGHSSVCCFFEQVTPTAAALLRTQDNFDGLLIPVSYPYILDNKTTPLAVPAIRKVSRRIFYWLSHICVTSVGFPLVYCRLLRARLHEYYGVPYALLVPRRYYR